MEIISLNGKKLSVGYNWEIIPTDAKQTLEAQMRKIAQDTGFGYAVPFIYENQVSAGFSEKKSKFVPGAIYIATAQQEAGTNNTDIRKDWIFVDKDDTGKYWYCAVRDGIPLPGQDVVSTEFSTITEQLGDILKSDTFILYTPLEEVRNFVEEEFRTPVIKKNFEELTEAVDDKKLAKSVKFKKLTGLAPKYMVAIGVVVFLGLSYFAYDMIDESLKKAKAVEMRRQQMELMKRQEEADFKNRVGKYYQDFYDARRKAFDVVQRNITQEPLAVASIWQNQFNFNVPQNGWQLIEMMCLETENTSPAEKLKCTKTYKRGSNTTNKMLLDKEPTAYMSSITADTAMVDTFYPVSDSNNSVSTYNFLNVDDFATNFVSDMQMLRYAGIKFELSGMPEEIKFKPPVVPLTKQETDSGVKRPEPASLKIGYAQGKFALSGNILKKYVEVMNSIQWRSVALQNTSFKFDNYANPSWNTQFNYILKSTADNLEPGKIGQYSVDDFPVKK